MAGAKHVLVVGSALAWIIVFLVCNDIIKIRPGEKVPMTDPWVKYGNVLAFCLVVVRYFPAFLTAPHTLLNAVGLVCYDTFPEPVKLKKHPRDIPLICLRIVTRGLYPKLVMDTVRKNINVLKEACVEHFKIEVVTDVETGVAGEDVKEIVVPNQYQTKKGALHKARALQYCLEEGVSDLEDDAWIVHLDEETLLTKDSINGILNFISDGSCDFGQGVVTYAKEKATLPTQWENFQHRICTVADSQRVAYDMGSLRAQFNLFHGLFLVCKGSFLVARADAEKEVSFDNGPEGSLGEDVFFGMKAMEKGHHKFGFVEGEANERSPFTFGDFVRQRRRWIQGVIRVVSSPRLTWRTRLPLAHLLAAWLLSPLMSSNFLLIWLFPFDSYPVADFLTACAGALGTFFYIFGYIKQSPIEKYSWTRMVLALPEVLLGSALGIFLECVAVCTTWFQRLDDGNFHIVEKDVAAAPTASAAAAAKMKNRRG